jgi:sec-independent protein translocase protein TatB
MFDIAFSEVMVIAVIALIVIGPERLPRVARTLGHLFGRMQRYVNDVKADIQREVELDELRRLKESVEDSARSIEQSMSHELNAARSEIQGLEKMAGSAVPNDAAWPSMAGAGSGPATMPGTATSVSSPAAPDTPATRTPEPDTPPAANSAAASNASAPSNTPIAAGAASAAGGASKPAPTKGG